MDAFAIERRVDDDAVVVRARGEIDSTTAADLSACLKAGLALASHHSARLLIVDLRAVTYFGSAGLNALLACHSEGNAAGTSVHLIAAHDQVIRPLQVTKLDTVLRVYPSPREAARPRRPETQP
ncbi:MAG TPA: STAS domain-containing protein [Mycobacterium sp.]|nr:STAS domain-containing protein [Mycobacterium sp.]